MIDCGKVSYISALLILTLLGENVGPDIPDPRGITFEWSIPPITSTGVRITLDFILTFLALLPLRRLWLALRPSRPSAPSIEGVALMVISQAECTIKVLRISLRLGEKGLSPGYVGAWIDLRVAGRFENLRLDLPFAIVEGFTKEQDGVAIRQEKNHLFFTDTREERETFEARLYYQISPMLESDGTRSVLSLPVKDLWYVGIPFLEGRHYPWIRDEERGELYVPAVEDLEVDVEHVDPAVTLDYPGMIPQPDVALPRQVRWLSGRDRRAHSSIVATFTNKDEQYRLQYRAFQAGAWFAILSSLALSTVLDLIWTVFSTSQ